MERYLILSDLDGTLANNNGEISETTQHTIQRLINQGHIFYICTGRMIQSVYDVAHSIDPRVLSVGSNGGVIQYEDHLETNPMEIQSLRFIAETAQRHHVNTFFFGTDVIIYTESLPDYFKNKDSKNRVSAARQTHYIRLSNDYHELDEHTIVNALFISEGDTHDILDTVRSDLSKLNNVTISSSYHNNIEIYPSTTSKGIALQTLAKHHAIPLERTLAFGDGNNDLEMLQAATISVAVANATPQVLDCATDFTLSNDNDGVAEFLNSYFKETHL